MAWMPGAIRKEVTRHDTSMVARRFVFHTAVSGASSLFPFFNQPGNATSHFYVRADGTIEQYVSTAYRAPAQLEGNHDCISVETQDMGPAFPSWSGSDVPAWSPAQLTALTQMSAWVAQVHGIPLTLLPDSIKGRAGFGYHRLGVNPWRVSSGELWSNATGKVCPGDRRIAQIPGILAAAQGDDVPLTITEIEAIAKRSAEWVWGIQKGGYQLQQTANQTRTMVATLMDDEAEIKQAIAASVVAIDEEALAAALAAQGVPIGTTPEQVKAAIREVLGGLDTPPA